MYYKQVKILQFIIIFIFHVSVFPGERTIDSKHMNHADTEAHDLWANSRLRNRKARDSLLGKMVGSGSGELLVQDLDDINMELEIDSENEILDTHRLISSSPPKTGFHDINHKKSAKKDTVNYEEECDNKDENVWSISIQMFIPFLLAGFGMVAASLLLDVVQVENHFSDSEFNLV